MAGIAQESVVERARRVLEPILARDGYELVDVEWVRGGGRWTLRVFIDREGGVNIDDCQLVSRTVEPILDVEDFIEPAYDLEVSSPGLDRPLRTPEHFARYAGQRVQVKAYGPVPGTAPGSPPSWWTSTACSTASRTIRSRRPTSSTTSRPTSAGRTDHAAEREPEPHPRPGRQGQGHRPAEARRDPRGVDRERRQAPLRPRAEHQGPLRRREGPDRPVPGAHDRPRPDAGGAAP